MQEIPQTGLGTIDVVHLRGGRAHVVIPAEWTTHPYTLVGQVQGSSIRLEWEDGTASRIPDGGGYLVTPGRRYRVIAPHTHPCTYRWAHLSVLALQTIDLLSLVRAGQPIEDGDRIGVLAGALALPPPGGILDQVRHAATRRQNEFALLTLILAVCETTTALESRLGSINRLLPILMEMSEHLDRPFSRTDLARMARLSPTRFHAVFSANLGCAPMAYLQRLRIRRAQDLLISSDRSIGDIAQEVGFPDQFHFSRLFKRSTGESPRSYRVQQQRQLRAFSA